MWLGVWAAWQNPAARIRSKKSFLIKATCMLLLCRKRKGTALLELSAVMWSKARGEDDERRRW